MTDRGARNLPLRHPAGIPTFILMVVLNFAILGILIDFLARTALIPPLLRGTKLAGDDPCGRGRESASSGHEGEDIVPHNGSTG